MDKAPPLGPAKAGSSIFMLLIRIAFPLVLVYLTWNPSGRSYYHWVIAPMFGGTFKIGPLQVLAGLLLVGGWVVAIQATRRSLGWGGTLLVSAIFAAMAWFLIDRGVFKPSSAGGFAHVGLVALGLVLAVGMSWGILRRGLTGQVEVDARN